MGLTFRQTNPKDPPPYCLVGYADINFIKDPKYKKSVIEYYFFFPAEQ